jgi:coenzyme F420-reducing hydrogenase alpha subunit
MLRGKGWYLVGPLARFNLNFEKLPAIAQQAAMDARLSRPCCNPFQSIVVRAVEMVFACAEALRVIAEYEPPPVPRIEPLPRAATGQAITEAPRGMLYHRFSTDEAGLIVTAKIVPPTSQNQRQIEEDLRSFAPRLASFPIDQATWRCEQAIRNYDPCISCATHFLKVKIDRV